MHLLVREKVSNYLIVVSHTDQITDDDVIDVIHEQLAINVTGMDRSEEVRAFLALYPWSHLSEFLKKKFGRPGHKGIDTCSTA